MTQFFDTQKSWQLLVEDAGYRVSLNGDHPYFLDHRVRGQKVLPGVVYLELAMNAVTKQFPSLRLQALEEIVWLRPIISRVGDVKIHIQLRQLNVNRIGFHINYEGKSCGYGFVSSSDTDHQSSSLAVPLSVRDIIGTKTPDHFSKGKIYRAFADMGIDYGPYFQRISYVQRYSNMALSWLANHDGVSLGWTSLMDCSFQAGMAISIGGHQDSLMPYSLGCLILHKPLPQRPLGRAFVLTEKLSLFRTNITIFDEEYSPLISVFDLGVKPSNLQ